MRSFREIKTDYRFTEEHVNLLVEMRPLMEENVNEVMGTLNYWLTSNKNTAPYFDDESRRRHVFESQRNWFLELFSGVYDSRYQEKLGRIGSIHVQFKVNPHYMSRAVNVIRNTCIGILSRTEDDREVMTNKIIALGKILDISLDVINTAYFEEEIKVYSAVYQVKGLLVDFSEKFSETMNLMLVLALIGLTLGVIWLFILDIRALIVGGVQTSEGIISALGSMLMLWVMIELMNTEISHLKGGKFHISVFVGVALVTTIRETMIATLRHERPEQIYYLIAAILVIGFIYWLLTRAEKQR